LSGPHIAPSGNDVVGNVVYAARSTDVRDVMVNGQMLMKNRRLHTLDEQAVLAAARKEAHRLGKALKGWK
jgi:5-methylthioadenosine/S-adenosylhomocysteine deaminase